MIRRLDNPKTPWILLAVLLWMSLGISLLGRALPPEARGQVAATHPLAESAAQDLLRQGGNAIDAAVAAALVLSVVVPDAAGLGGGALILIRPGGGEEPVVFDALERAPASAREPVREGWTSVGVPGALAGLLAALEQYGTFSRGRVMQPAIRLAQEGFPLDTTFIEQLRLYRSRLSPQAASVFLRRGRLPRPGQKLVQRDLAWSYRQIARSGAEAFYRGGIAQRIVAASAARITREDLERYVPRMRRPIHTTYRRYEVLTAPPPCASGLPLIQSLNFLEPFDIPLLGRGSPSYVHILAEVLRRTDLDRRAFVGDTEAIPLQKLLSKAYAAQESIPIHQGRVAFWDIESEIPPPTRSAPWGRTAAVVASDVAGNLVVIALTLHAPFGSGIVVPGTGVLLNAALVDFTSADVGMAGRPHPNRLSPGKRPATPLAPVVVLRQGRPFLAMADQDPRTTPATLLQILLGVADFGWSIREALEEPRMGYDPVPGRVLVEWRMNLKIPELIRKGHTVRRVPRVGAPLVVGSPLAQIEERRVSHVGGR